MKNKPSNFDQKIVELQVALNKLDLSADNNNQIGELSNKILPNLPLLNRTIPNIKMVSSYIFLFLLFQLSNGRINYLPNNINEKNINNKLLLNYLVQTDNIPNNALLENLNNQINFINNNNNRYQNNIMYESIYHDKSHDNLNVKNIYNHRNINNNFINNFTEQNKFGENTYLYNNMMLNDLNNINPILNPYLNLSNNNLQNYNNNLVNENINLSKSYNLNRTNNNFVNNNIENKESLFNLIQINKNPQKILDFKNKSLTSKLCNKIGINQIKTLLKNEHYSTDLIRKLILTLNKENGLYKVFTNIYGNYFIQNLFQKMNSDLIQLTIDLISSEFVNIAKSPSGTHCLQELLNFIDNSEKEISIIKAIKYKEKELAFDNHAIYVLKKIISVIPDIKRVRLNNIIIDNAKELILNANSVFILKRFMATNTIEENKKRLLNIIKRNFLVIAQNPFGNYAIQYIFEVWPLKDCEIIIYEIFDKVNDLSCHRFSFNIIIKALNIFSLEYKNKLIYILCFSSNIMQLLNNKYGIFVINKAIDNMDSEMKKKLENYLKINFNNNSSKEEMLINQIIALLNN